MLPRPPAVIFCAFNTSVSVLQKTDAPIFFLYYSLPENPALKPQKTQLSGINLIFSYVGLSWVSWILKNYELGLAGLAGF